MLHACYQRGIKIKKTIYRKQYPPIYEKINKGLTYYVVKAKRSGYTGKGEEWFKTLSEAITRAQKIAEDVDKYGIKEAALDGSTIKEVVRGIEMLRPYGMTTITSIFLREIEYQRSLQQKQNVKTVQELVNEWLEERRTFKFKKSSHRTLEELKDRGNHLIKQFGSMKVCDITRDMMVEFLTSMNVSLRTKHNRKNKFNQFFRWVKIEKKQIKENPCEGIKFKATLEHSNVSLVPMDKVKQLLKTSLERDKNLFYFFLLGFFSGLRPEEAQRMKYENIDLNRGEIHVERWMSKTRQERLIKILPTLKTWLAAYPPPKSGRLFDKTWKFTASFNKARVLCGYRLSKGKNRLTGEHLGYHNEDGLEWKEDCVRHSFASYSLVMDNRVDPVYGSRATLAEYLGNSVNVINNHYRKMVPKNDGVKYFNILPTTI